MADAQPVSASEEPPVEYDLGEDIRIEFTRFPVPNYAKVKALGNLKNAQDLARIPAVSINLIPPKVLDNLCKAMLDEIYAKAGRENPFGVKENISGHC